MNLLIEVFGWTLLHFLWQGAAIAGLLWAALQALRSAPATWRYAVSGIGLLAMVAASTATGIRQWQVAARSAGGAPSTFPLAALESPRSIAPPLTDSPSTPPESAESMRADAPTKENWSSAEIAASKPTLQNMRRTLRPCLPWIVAFWAAGVLGLSVGFFRSWLALRRLRSGAHPSADEKGTAIFIRLLDAMRFQRTVALLTTTAATVPMVVGWLRPAILVPTVFLTRLPAWQIEAILAHELAHVRRHDFLVNLLQNIVETVFFYHPAVWWISAQLRKEREHCCDDTAAALCGGALDYAKALTALEEMRGFTPVGAVSAAGGSLLARIRRLLGVPALPNATAFSWPTGLALALLSIGILVGSRMVQAEPDADGPTIRGLALESLPQSDDITKFADLYEPDPDNPGEVRKKAGVFFMSLRRDEADVGPWLYYPANAKHFYLSVRPDPGIVKDIIYGPISGHPVDKLDLAAWLRDSPNHRDPGYARRVARDMLACGDPSLGRLALDWLGEFKAPSPPGTNDHFIDSLENHLATQPTSPFAERVRQVLAHLAAMKEIATADWDAKRETLPEEQYSPGKPLAEAEAGIVWGEAKENGLRLGVSGVTAHGEYPIGSTLAFDAFVRNDGKEPVKFAWTGRVDEGLRAILEGEGTRTEASITPFDGLLIHMRCRLDPGSFLQVKYGAEFRILQAKEDGTSPETDFRVNHFLLENPGTYTLEVVCSLGTPDWTDSNGTEHPHPANEWTGTLSSKLIEFSVTAKANGNETSYLDRPFSEWDELLTESLPSKQEILHTIGYGKPDVAIPEAALPMLLELIKSGSPATQCRGMGTLSKLENPSDEVLDALISKLEDATSAGNRSRAGYVLAVFKGRSDYTVPRMIPLLQKGDAATQRAAAFALGQIGTAAQAALPALKALRDGASEELFPVIDEAVENIRNEAAKATEDTQGDGLVLFIVDAQTNEPIGRFQVIAGVPSGVSPAFEEAKGVTVSNWQSHTLRDGRDGEFTWPADKGYAEMALRIEADGYVPQVIDGLAKGAKEILHLALQRDPGIEGSVQTPGHKRPAHDATVVLAMIRRNAQLVGTTFPELQRNEGKTPRDLWDRPRVVTPDENGRFTLPTEIDPTAVVLILHGDGVYEKPYAEWRKAPDVTLEPWGRIHGKVQWGDKVGAGEKVDLIINRGDQYGYPDIIAQYDETTANEDGSFVFERVLPGLAQLSCPIEVANKEGGTLTVYGEGRVTHAEISAPHTAVLLGGVGRTVSGKLSGRDHWEGVTFRLHPTAPHIGRPGDGAMWEAWNALRNGPFGAQFFRDGLKVTPDGGFEIPRVLPGSYQIFFTSEGQEQHLASDQFRIPAEDRDHAPEPMDLGEIKATTK